MEILNIRVFFLFRGIKFVEKVNAQKNGWTLILEFGVDFWKPYNS